MKGTGGAERSEIATVTFTVFDELGSPVSDTLVNFELTTDVGGIEIRPESQSKTDENGRVDVIVSAGRVAIPVRVIATLDEFPTISTISGSLSISTGVTDYNSFSLSATTLNPDTWQRDGIEVGITARLADHFNNPVPDGTIVQFTTEFGAIAPNCLTVNGACSVNWRSQNPRLPDPAYRDDSAVIRTIQNTICRNTDGTDNGMSQAGLPCFYNNHAEGRRFGGLGSVYGNRISIFAHVLGEESFSDSNGNGQYDPAESFVDANNNEKYDIGENYTDSNNNGKFDAGESFTDLSEAFRDDNEDGIYGNRLDNGDLAGSKQNFSEQCDGVTCFESGGDNEFSVDLNGNQEFDLGNKIYNGVLCTSERAALEKCSRKLVSVSKNLTILQAGNGINGGLIQLGSVLNVPANYGQTVDLKTGPKSITLFVSDNFNGYLPSGTTITFDTGNGEIVGPSECTVVNTSAFGFNSCSVSLKADDEASSGSMTATVLTEAGDQRTFSVIVND